MSKLEDQRVKVLETVQSPLGFFSLVVLVVELILGVLAAKATGIDFTILVVSMVVMLFLLVLLVDRAIRKDPSILLASGKQNAVEKQNTNQIDPAPTMFVNDKLKPLSELLPPSLINTISEDARKNSFDHIRIACTHTIWSCRPDLARPILQDATADWAEEVREHAKALLQMIYLAERNATTSKILDELLSTSLVGTISEDARKNSSDHIRIACTHTIWSCHPELAKPILEDARSDWAEDVRDHAKALLQIFYWSGERPVRDTATSKILIELLSTPMIRKISEDARKNSSDHIRIACAHTIWSCHPDRARSILEDASSDTAEEVRDHAKSLLYLYQFQ
jgi:hypothetical protein